MDRTQKLTTVSLAALAAVIAFLKWRKHPSVTAPPAGVDPFMAPYQYATPGISDDPVTLNGGAPFQSTVNVTVNPSYLGTLSQTYIPMFGFVGTGGGGPGQPAPSQLSAPPPPAATFAAPAPTAYVAPAPSANVFAATQPAATPAPTFGNNGGQYGGMRFNYADR